MSDKELRETLAGLAAKWRKSLGREVWAVVINNARADELEAALAAHPGPADTARRSEEVRGERAGMTYLCEQCGASVPEGWREAFGITAFGRTFYLCGAVCHKFWISTHTSKFSKPPSPTETAPPAKGDSQ